MTPSDQLRILRIFEKLLKHFTENDYTKHTYHDKLIEVKKKLINIERYNTLIPNSWILLIQLKYDINKILKALR